LFRLADLKSGLSACSSLAGGWGTRLLNAMVGNNDLNGSVNGMRRARPASAVPNSMISI
jgi:hypothetical protein